jgi:hypothetical protein
VHCSEINVSDVVTMIRPPAHAPLGWCACASIAAESLPTEREHILVPDHSRVVDEPPNVENDALARSA